jgi:hypothetical protein
MSAAPGGGSSAGHRRDRDDEVGLVMDERNPQRALHLLLPRSRPRELTAWRAQGEPVASIAAYSSASLAAAISMCITTAWLEN